MNKHILLVMKWLADASSVSQEEREKNRREAWYTAARTARTAWAAYDAAAAAHATTDRAAYDAVAAAAYWATFPCSDNAEYWVNKYFETTGEDRNEYLKELNK